MLLVIQIKFILSEVGIGDYKTTQRQIRK